MKKQISALVIGASVLLSTSAMAGSVGTSRAIIPGVAATLKNIEKTINALVDQSEIYYIDNHITAAGDPVVACGPARYDVLNAGSGAVGSINPYINFAVINTDCTISITMWDSTQNIDPTLHSSPDVAMLTGVAGAMSNVSIMLVPIFDQVPINGNLPDGQITAWECITNYDRAASQFISGGTVPAVGSMSRITYESTNAYLAQCVYNTFTVDPVINTTPLVPFNYPTES